MKGLFLFSIFVITYGSLFPFNFQYVNSQEEGFNALFATSLLDGKFADVIGNIILFLPFGFAGTVLISRAKKPRQYIFCLYMFGIALAVGLQFLQIYLPYRVPALYDAAWNYVGIFVGSLAAHFMSKKYPEMLAAEDRMALLALSLCWILFLLTPFMFSFNLTILRENIQIHLDPNEYRMANVLFYTGVWLSYKKLMDEIRPGKRQILLSLEFVFVFTLLAKIFIYRNIIEPELLPGGIIAILMLRSHLFNKVNPYKVAAALLVPTMFYNSIYPLEFYGNPFKEFMWIPFSELFSDDMLPIVRTVFYKTFAYGAIVWTLYKSFPNSNWISYSCVIYAGLIEYLQHLTLARVGGLTEPLIVLFLVTFIHQVPEKFSLYEETDANTS